ncbi:MAG: Arylsulfatase [candidate division BRC1 bacterium ADurb.BinA364]|nr:MAG: Arylsulfatase [candidate division BRC1 bacterium ADurb.BinA364]
MFVSWHPPHNWGGQTSYEAPQEWLDLYRDPAPLRCRHHGTTSEEFQQSMRGYMALCSNIDWNVGRILDKLDSIGAAEDTLVVFTSDHGDLLGMYEGRPSHKCSPEDASCRVPLLMRWPQGLGRPRQSDLLAGTLDLMPTILGLLDLPVPMTCQGVDLSRAIREENDDAVESQPLFMFMYSWRGVYTRDFTYSEMCPGVGRPEPQPQGAPERFDCLFDKREDPWCARNFWNAPGYEKTQAELAESTRHWMRRFGDPFVDFAALQLATTGEVVAESELYKRSPADCTLKKRPVEMLEEYKKRFGA